MDAEEQKEPVTRTVSSSSSLSESPGPFYNSRFFSPVGLSFATLRIPRRLGWL